MSNFLRCNLSLNSHIEIPDFSYWERKTEDNTRDSEVMILINIWSDVDLQAKLDDTHHNHSVFEETSKEKTERR